MNAPNAVLRRTLIYPVLSNDCFSKIFAENKSKNNELHNKTYIIIITKIAIQRNRFAPQLPT